MISAKGARELVLSSKANIESTLNRLGEAIEKEANLGKTKLSLDHAFPYGPKIFEVEKPPFSAVGFTPVQELYRKELHALGYGVKIVSVEHDGTGILGNLDDPVPSTSYHIEVSW